MGSVLLQDFNDLNAHRVLQDDIFNYLTAVETLKQWAQKEEQTPLVKNYLKFWKQIPKLFQHFTQQLLENKVGYLGLLFSESVENISLYLMHTSQYHYLIGFNALTKSESLLIQKLLVQTAEIFVGILTVNFMKIRSTQQVILYEATFENGNFLKGLNPVQWGMNFQNPKPYNV